MLLLLRMMTMVMMKMMMMMSMVRVRMVRMMTMRMMTTLGCFSCRMVKVTASCSQQKAVLNRRMMGGDRQLGVGGGTLCFC